MTVPGDCLYLSVVAEGFMEEVRREVVLVGSVGCISYLAYWSH